MSGIEKLRFRRGRSVVVWSGRFFRRVARAYSVIGCQRRFFWGLAVTVPAEKEAFIWGSGSDLGRFGRMSDVPSRRTGLAI